jgi:pyrophosphatase PpaX
MTPGLQAILFDLDGTLLDSRAQDEEQIRLLLTDILQLPAGPEDIAHYYGMPSQEILQQVAPDRVNELMPKLEDLQRQTENLTMVFPGIKTVVKKLAQAKFSLGVVTSKTRQELIISRTAYDLPEQIEVWVAADDVVKPKPDPAPVLKALNLLGCSPAEAVMIGDTHFDMQAGRSAGTMIGSALWGQVDNGKLASFKPEFMFKSPQEMEQLLKWKKN